MTDYTEAIARLKENSGYDRDTQRARDIRALVEAIEGQEYARRKTEEFLENLDAHTEAAGLFEYGTEWPLSEEAHGPGKTVVYPAKTREEGLREIAIDQEAAHRDTPLGRLVKRVKAGEWRDA